MRATQRLLPLLCLLCPPCRPPMERPAWALLTMMASASAATASWKTVWADEFESEDVDLEKWAFPAGNDDEAGAFAAGAGAEGAGDGRDGGIMNGDGFNKSTRTKEEHPARSALSNAYVQAYIGAHDYLVMASVTARSQSTKLNANHVAEASIQGASTLPTIPRGRISSSHSADFSYGRVEIRAKLASRGSSGLWLMPSDVPVFGHTPCARISVAEIRAKKHNTTQNPARPLTASLSFGHYEEDRWGCTNSDVWPDEGSGCSSSAEHAVDWSDAFHVYALEWEEDEIRWYVDGMQYCSKSSWFSKNPDDFPAPFNNAFHIEMGVETDDRDSGSFSGADDGGGLSAPDRALHSPSELSEMLVDYVRITQGPQGIWAPAPPLEPPPADAAAEEGLGPLADGGLTSSPPRALDIIINAIAVCACVLGPYMAMTGLSRARVNTIMMGMEIGAFKAANASYIFSGSYVMAFAGAVTFGILCGFLAVRHRAMARWNTVAGLSVPALFVLIDVGMISDIGSKYVCWAIFFVLTVTFALLVFPSEHHALGFAVAAAATGSCVLKLGLGWLLGESGEIFKILDDPIGDQCHASRVCQSLNFVMGGMFLVGLCSQKFMGPLSKDCGSCIVADSDKESGLFTPPRYRFPAKMRLARPTTRTATRKDTCSSSSDFELEDHREPVSADEGGRSGPDRGRRDGEGEEGGRGEGERRERQEHCCDETSYEYDEDEAFIMGEAGTGAGRGGVWERASAGTKSIIDAVLHPLSSYRRRQQSAMTEPPDSPTPVPMPLSGVDSNAVVSSEGDIIELVIHSPHKSVLHHRRPSGWFPNGGSGSDSGGGSGGRYRADDPQSPSLGEREGERQHARGRRQRALTIASTPSSNADEDALSILSASDLITAEESAPLVATTTAPASSTADQGHAERNRGTSYGRLADAFSEKWGAWVQDSNSSDGNDDICAKGERTGPEGTSVHQPMTRGSGSGVHQGVGDAHGQNVVRGHSVVDGSYKPGRSAREFDREALLQSPYESRSEIESKKYTREAAEGEDSGDSGGSRVAHRLGCASSSSSIHSDRWVWRHGDGILSPSSSSNSVGGASSQGGSAAAGGPEYGLGLAESGAGMRDDSDVVDAQVCTSVGQAGTGATRKSCSLVEKGSDAKTRHQATGVGAKDETKATVEEVRGSAQGQETGRETTSTSLLEIEL